MDFDAFPLDIPPGIVKMRSPLDVRGRYTDCDKVRWEYGRPRKMGGWSRLTGDSLGAPGRGAYPWVNLAGEPLIAFGTYEKAFVYHDGALEDITPVGFVPGNLDLDTTITGWGELDWGEGPWGGAGLASIGPANPLVWSFAAYGEDLLLMPRWGGLYIWDSSVGGVATAVTNAPTEGLGVFVSQDSRHVVVYGADGDGVLVKWADQETTTSWTPSATGTAGDKRADDGNAVMGHIHTRGGTLIVTGGSAHFVSYVGRPYAFGVKKIADNCGMIAPLAGVDLNGVAYWMGNNGFFAYDGAVRRLECDVNDYVFDRMNGAQRFKICAGINTRYGEVWWHYPIDGSASLENEEYVIYNTRENCWYTGTMGRSAWTEDHDVSPYPVAVDDEGTIFNHEIGVNDGASEMAYYLETGEIDMVDGKYFSHVRQVVPDFLDVAGDHQFTLTTRKRPRDQNPRTRGPYMLSTLTDKKSIRVRSNSFRFKLAGSGLNTDFKGGLFRLRIKQRGQR